MLIRYRFTALIGLAVAAAPTPLRGQEVGARVRVSLSDTTIIGVVSAVSAEGFELLTGEVRRSVAYREVERLEWSAGFGTESEEESWTSEPLDALVASLTRRRPITSTTGRPTVAPGDRARITPEDRPTVAPTDSARVAPEDRHMVAPEDRSVIAPGDRVRFSLSDATIVGLVRTVRDEGFDFVQGDVQQFIAYRDVDHLEVSRGTRSLWLVGLIPGVIGGAAVGKFLPASSECSSNDSCHDEEQVRMLIGSVTGAALGAGAGWFFRIESWESLTLDHLRVSFSPIVSPQLRTEGARGLVLGTRFKF